MEDFEKDPRVACKYGANCYQKNASHKSKFKHPPREENGDLSEKAKRFKKSEEDTKSPTEDNNLVDVKADHNISDSDEDSAQPSPTVKSKSDIEEQNKKLREEEEKSVQGSEVEEEDDGDELPPSPADVKLSIKQKFLVEMPDDFYSFWEFCQSLSKDKGTEALKDVNLFLAGPYDVLSGKISRSKEKKTLQRFLRHWRYYYDPPEFQTVLISKDKDLYHIGYFRDDPNEMPCFMASNFAAKDGILSPMGPNIFAAVNAYLDERKKIIDPFAKIKLAKLQKALQAWAEKEGHSLDTINPAMKQRTRNAVCKTFHGAGLVVPYNKTTDIGYRPLMQNNVNLKKIVDKVNSATSVDQAEDALESLQPIITAANIANDECDFGTSVELGLDLFTSGGDILGKEALHLLATGYILLKRKEFTEIAKAHLKNRRKGRNVDMFP